MSQPNTLTVPTATRGYRLLLIKHGPSSGNSVSADLQSLKRTTSLAFATSDGANDCRFSSNRDGSWDLWIGRACFSLSHAYAPQVAEFIGLELPKTCREAQ